MIEAVVKLSQSFIEHNENLIPVWHLESKKLIQQTEFPKYIYRLLYKHPDVIRYYSLTLKEHIFEIFKSSKMHKCKQQSG